MKAYGGFTPFKFQKDMSGLGDFWSDVGVDPNYQGTQASTLPIQTVKTSMDVVSSIGGIPSWALLVGGFVVAALILPTGRR